MLGRHLVEGLPSVCVAPSHESIVAHMLRLRRRGFATIHSGPYPVDTQGGCFLGAILILSLPLYPGCLAPYG